MASRAINSLTICVLGAAGFTFESSPAFAVDGVILIDQNKALAGNVSPGDAPGFPVSIRRPGSYRLAGNLTVPSGLNGIEITESNVTVDLNGFSLLGTPQNGAAIIFTGVVPAKGLAIRNGVISGFDQPFDLGGTEDVNNFGWVNGAQTTLQDLYIAPARAVFTGLNLGEYSRVMNITATS
jgi:hypothetical protein